MRKMTKVLAVLVILAMVLPGIAQATSLSADDDIRIAGSNRYLTAVEASKLVYPNGADTVVLATGQGYADALTGTVLAAHEDAPLLLTKSGKIQDEVLAEIARLGAKNVVVLGGLVAVNESVEDLLVEKGLEVERIAGDDRYDTAKKIAERLGNEGGQAFLVSGVNFKDALSIGPVAAMKGVPILLTKPGELHTKTKEALEGLKVREVVVIGGPVAVNKKVLDEVEDLDLDTDRVYGDNAVDTGLEVAKKYFSDPEKVFVASSADFADGLVAGYLAAKLGGPVVLVKPNKTDEKVTEYIKDTKADVNVIGGKDAVSEDVVEDIGDAIEEGKKEEDTGGGTRPVGLNLVSVDKAVSEGTYTFTVKGKGDDLGRLHVLLHDGSLEPEYEGHIDGTTGKIEYLVLYASDGDGVYGEDASKSNVEGFGVTASYVQATQTWTVTVTGSTVENFIKDHKYYPGSNKFEDVKLFFYLSNEDDRNDRSNIIESDFSTVELNLVSVDKAVTNGVYTFIVKGKGDDLGRLHVLLHTGLDASYEAIDGTTGKIEYLVLNASANELEVYGNEESETKVTGFGVTASYVKATQTWTVTVDGAKLQGVLGGSINFEDIGLLFYVSNKADRNVRSENIIASDFSKEVVEP